MDKITVKKLCKVLRVKTGLSQEKIARLLGVHRRTVSYWERLTNKTVPATDKFLTLKELAEKAE